MYTIIGSGFGLYGYLPALIRELDAAVALPEAYRPKVLARPELGDCVDRVTWKADRNACLDAADRAIVCLPPVLQESVCDELARLVHIGIVVLEKPVARDPQSARRVYEKLVESGKSVIVDYSFLYSTWYERLKAMLSAPATAPVSIVWTFRAHHYQHDLHSWKRTPDEGGGVLRFYGIHLVATLASLGYTQVAYSRIESSGSQPAARWHAGLVKPGAPTVTVILDSNAAVAQFALRPDAAGSGGLATDDPFSDADFVPRWPAEDRRIRPLARMLRSTSESPPPQALYRRVNALWAEVENCTAWTS